MAHAGVEAAALNVKINLSSIKDTEFVQKISLELRELQQRTAKKTTTILVIVEKSL
jgi:formiminotetrahydrofolate cyclodeaminase